MTLNIDNENIVKIGNTPNHHNHHKRHWMSIYEVIQKKFFDETDILSENILNNARKMQIFLLIYQQMSKIS